jgi:CRISPR/Cas system-associated exonuclease Cas4 (RecB family)
MRDWEKHFQEFNDLLQDLARRTSGDKAELRFNCSFVKASDIAEQYFCEKKLEMQHLYGQVKTEEKSLGTEAHEKLLKDTTRIRRKKLWQKIYGKIPILAHEMLLVAKYKGVALAGISDCVLFASGFPAIVFEYKFTRTGRIFNSHQVQARTYGILLRNMGFDTSRLFCAVVIVDPKAKDDCKLKLRVVDVAIKNGPKDAVLTVENARIFFSRFDETKAEQDLEWALEFWKRQRDAVPTRNPNKCINCEYSSECKKPSAQRTLV